jgi:hypothetical protein
LQPYGFLLGSVDKKYKTSSPVKTENQDAGPAASA